jgi:hypothetical protein
MSAGNSVLCRIYHLSVANTGAAEAAIHCVHGSVGGGNGCGNQTVNICGMLNHACPTQFPSTSACETLIETLMADNKTGNVMTVQEQTDDTVGCRVYNGGRALSAKGMGNATAQAGLCMMAAQMGGCGAMMPPSMAPTTAGAPFLAASAVLALLPLLV